MSDQISLNYTASLELFKIYQGSYPEKRTLQKFSPEFDTSKTKVQNLNQFASLSLDSNLTTAFLISLDKIFLDLVSRWISDSTIEDNFVSSSGISSSLKGVYVLSALGRIIDLSPEIAPLVEFFLESNPIFQSLENNANTVSESEVHDLVLAFYRLLRFDQSRFLNFISPDTISLILKESSNLVIKFLCIQLLSKYLNLTEKATNDMLRNQIGDEQLIASYENDTNIDYKFLPILEAQRFANYHKINVIKNEHTSQETTSIFIEIDSSDLSPLVVSVCGVLVPKIHFDQQFTKSIDFVPTPRSVNALKELAYNVQHSKPVVLVGGAGSGKTFIINELSKYLACDKSIVKIHLGDQTDAKLLLGTYSSGSKPGTFEWRNGVLTTAVQEGRWVLIEDIDKAPTEVLSILLSLLEKRELIIPSRGEVIKAANGFQLISTIRTSNDSKKATIPDLIGMRLWTKLSLNEPSREELSQILIAKYQLLEKLIPSFLQLYDLIHETYNSKSFLFLNKGAHLRVISIRDLIKFCKRVNVLFKNNDITDPTQLITTSIVEDIFAEAVDCFASALSEQAALTKLINIIGESLQVSSSRIQLFLQKRVPLYEDFEDHLVIGRAHLKKAAKVLYLKKNHGNNTSFARTNHSLRLMEQIGVSVQMAEPVLLVGETGTGKTTVVQQVAKQLNKKITVINVSQQTEAGDLLGGFKPVNIKSVAVPIQENFLNLFQLTFSTKKNEKFEKALIKCFNRNQWKNAVKLWNEAARLASKLLADSESDSDEVPKKKRKMNSNDRSLLLSKWDEFTTSVKNFEAQSETMESSFVFNFVEGSLVQAVKNGDWLLLDEINLASSDTLESISDLLSDIISQRSVLLSEKGEVESIQAHPDFRIFGCMNPATDVGKRDLPLSIRSRFTEVYVHSPDSDISDLLQIIDRYVGRFALNDEWVGNDIAQLYLEAKKLADSNKIVDGANQKPHFSIRTLTRTLLYVCDIYSIYGLRRSLFEGFSMSFLTLLDQDSEAVLKPLIEQYTIGRLKNAKSVVSHIPPAPSTESGSFVQFRHYWMKQGPFDVIDKPNYIITPFVEKNLLNLVRATSGKRFPILVQGPTSSGKTSMIKYLSDITGNKFVRINNHEHTDLQEYLGTYVSDDTGKLSFKEGVLVEALRKGYWLVLDELNLAPTDVLEALNRLLDDNRELFIPETQEVVHPHPNFMLFATQNPPGLYGGRKVLSRAFRNRFLELHFDDIPQDELEVILRERCKIAPSYAKRIVEVYRQLSIQRQSSRLFEQKNSFATLRDLFRWALREAVGYEELAANGYMLLAERVRKPDEKLVVKQTLEKVMKVKLDMDAYYESLENKDLLEIESSVVWTKAIRRLAVLIAISLKNDEPVLLVGETGCGKTTVCQLLAEFSQKKLITVNAHQNTETGDLLGAQRPVRNKSQLKESLLVKLIALFQSLGLDSIPEDLDDLLKLYDEMDKEAIENDTQIEIKNFRDRLNLLFEWSDGPLVQALKTGQYFLLDEISLADDSVLERLNSVLEPERSLLLAEKGAEDSSITALDGFQFLSTMNPGGDYGKKELSPALRNRFTEIWVPSIEDFNDVFTIVETKLQPDVKGLAPIIVEFSEAFGKKLGGGDVTSGVISLRDILAWVEFINKSYISAGSVGALLHGACMVFIDALGTNNTAYLAESAEKLAQDKLEWVEQLSELAKEDLSVYYNERPNVSIDGSWLTAGKFKLERKENTDEKEPFSFEAPTTAKNAMRVVRALQLNKPILLEGSPGVGKTSLVSALAKASGNPLTRINLSEQTDLVDLFGSDAPVEGGKTGDFSWRDAPFLRAMQKGEWVLLDEMNLASQSVLEGLNACLDHRGEAYIPELDKSFSRHPNFLVFAAQNPQYQGGGRKGLPKSFVNRFSVVYVDTLSAEDLILIAHHLYPNIPEDVCANMINIVSRLDHEISILKKWGTAGGPWEFNLRDTLRWLQLYDSPSLSDNLSPVDFMDIIICQRFRNEQDRENARSLVEEVFGEKVSNDNLFVIGETFIQAKKAILNKNDDLQLTAHPHLSHLQSNTSIVESSLFAIQNNWPLIYVGPTNAGKTELVRYLATVSNSKVVEFSMNSDIDSMDILGGYEQVDLTREVTLVIGKLLSYLKLKLSSHLQNESLISEAIVGCLKLVSFLNKNHITLENYAVFIERYRVFEQTVKSDSDIEEIGKRCAELFDKINKSASVRFEWFDGLLVKAVEEGHWLVLDNANLCSPSVLDRLNSLLEINGSLIINECSLADGQPRILKPHKDFRLFLTMDPRYGELSRAMRNRGVEIHMDALETRSSSFDKKILNIPIEKEEGDELNLSLLSVNDLQSIPMAKFIDASDSFSFYIAAILDTLTLSQDEDHISRILATIVPFTSQTSLPALLESISKSSEFSEKIVEGMGKLLEFTNFLNSSGFNKKFYQLYAEVSEQADSLVQAPINFDRYQKVNPLWNIYVYVALNKNAELESPELISFFELLDNLFESSNLLKQVELKGTSGKLSELSYIEQCYAAASGRNMKNEPRLNIYKLLQGLQEFIISRIHPLSAQEIVSSNGLFTALYRLSIIWLSLAESSATKNDSKTRVFQKFLRNWSLEAESQSVDVEDFNKLLDAFESDLKLKRGTLMTPIWEKFRGSYPQNGESWLLNSEIISLMGKFDKVSSQQFSDSESLVSSLSTSVLVIYEDIISNNLSNVEDAFEKLQNGIQVLEDISSKFLIKRVHTFEESFKILFKFVVADSSQLNDDLLTLAYHSGLGTSALAGFGNQVYPSILDKLWEKKNSTYHSHTSSIFTDLFLQSTFVAVGNFNNSSAQQLDQTVADSIILSRQLIKNSNSVMLDRVQQHRKIILSWYSKIISLVSVGNVEGDLESTIKASSEVEDEFFQSINNTFLIPAVKQAEKSFVIEDLGQAWVLFAIGLIQLYVPDSPYDPAIEEHVVYSNFERKKALISSISSSFKSIRTVTFGDDSIFIEKYLPSVEESDVPDKPRVFRSNLAIDNLFEEWQSFMISTIDVAVLQGFLEAAEDEEMDKLALQFDLFQQNSSSFIDRLQSQFTDFSDVNDIFKGYVFSLKLGFDLILESRKQFHSAYKVSPLWFINPQQLTIPKSFDSGFNELKEFSKSIDVDSSVGEKILRYLMDYSLSDSLNSGTISNDQLEQVFQALYYRWSLRAARKEQKEAEEGSVFRFKGEVDADEDFKELFPDYEDFVQTGEGVTLAKSTSDLTDEIAAIAERYVSLFLEKKPVTLTGLINEGSSLSKQIIESAKEFKNSQADPSTLAVIIQKLNESINAVSTPVSGSDLDFYHGYSTSEMKRSIDIIQKLLKSVRDLLEQWPEHATLQTLDRISLEYLSYPVKTPMAKLIQKIEQIYTFISEWEKYASVKVSLKVHFDELTVLIVSWRKLELASWQSLFKNEDVANSKSIGVWWFNLFETIILPSYGNEEIDLAKLISSLNIFISKSTYGQYTPRLNLLKAFTEHTLLISKDTGLKKSLKNLITYYEQFTPIIDEHLKKERKRLQKEVDEVILLASWKDVNIDALKQSARRSHHNLYKHVRKYRDVLGTEVTSLIEGGLSSDRKVPNFQFKVNVAPFDSLDLDKFSSDMKDSLWNERPSRLKYSPVVTKNMEVYKQRLEDREYPNLLEFIKETVDEMDRLKSETPKEYNEEKKKLIASLKTQKRKLLTDTIRELRRIGLKSHLRDDIHKLQSSATLILANSEPLRDTKLSEYESYFFRILDLLPRLKATVGSVAEDVPVADAEKGLAIIENLIYYLITNKKSLFKVIKGFERLETIQKEFTKVTKLNGQFLPKSKLEISSETVNLIFRWLPQLLDFVIEISSISTRTLSIQVDTSLFYQLKSELKSVERKLSETWSFNSVTAEIYSDFEKFLRHHISLLQSWKSSNSSVGFLADIIINWINSLDKISPEETESAEKIQDLTQVDSYLKSLSSKILVVFQKVTESSSQIPSISQDDDKWFSTTQKELQSVIKSLHIEQILRSFDSLFQFIQSNSFDIATTSSVEKIVALAQPFLKGYMELMAIVLNKYKDNYYDVSRSTYILSTSLYNLAKDGFCSPQEQGEEKQSDNLQDGTGLGDGEGAQNNSNDVEDDEDLTENAQEENKDKDDNKDEEDDNDDAVDIEGDMAGDLENLSDQDKDDDDQDKDKEEEELDEEVDDLDDLDPNAVDDKMWDEEAKDDKKEKDSENMPENSKSDDLQAMEDEEQSESKDQSNDQEGEDDNKDENENDEEEGSEEEDVGQQDDDVKNEEREELEQNVPETETLDLPDDINLDSGDEDEEEDKDGDDNQDLDDGLDDKMDLDDEEEMNKEEDEGNEEDIQESEEKDEVDEEDSGDIEEEVADKPDEDMEEGDNANEEEDPLQQGEQSDEELDNAGEDPNEKKDEEEVDGDQMEGIDNAETGDNNNEEIDMETAVEQEAGDKGEGAQTKENDENEDVGATGSAQFQEQPDAKDDSSKDDAHDDAKESLKQLGDSLKEFHRRHQEIKESSEKDETVEQSANERPDEFEHLDGENTENDTQALGAANKDQVSKIDEEMAIDDDEEEDHPAEGEDEPEAKEGEAIEDDSDKEEVKNDEDENPDEFNGKTKGGFIGERKEESNDDEENLIKAEIEEDEEVEDELESNELRPYSFDDEDFRDIEEARSLWRKSELETQDLAANLTEQLRLILEPTLATKLKGDYKTGKRLNMKRIIPYIASDFRKDKIWLRRTKPSKRQYQIMIAVDDSKSMSESKSVDLAFQSICLVSKALTQLESGGLSIVKFGEDVKVVHPFEKQFSPETGAKIFQKFDFQQTRTNTRKLVSDSIEIFNNARALGDSDLWQLQIIISDGVCEDHDTLQRLVRRAREEKIMLVFVVIDGINSNESILDMQQVRYETDSNGNMVLKVDKYLDSFPFEFYVVVHDISELPKMLSLILRQYFTELASS